MFCWQKLNDKHRRNVVKSRLAEIGRPIFTPISTHKKILLIIWLTSLFGYAIITIIEQDESLMVTAVGIKDIGVSVYEI